MQQIKDAPRADLSVRKRSSPDNKWTRTSSSYGKLREAIYSKNEQVAYVVLLNMQAALQLNTACIAMTSYPNLHYNMPTRYVKILSPTLLDVILTSKMRACTATIEARRN